MELQELRLPTRTTSCGTPFTKPRAQAARAASFLNDLIIRTDANASR
jgi:hypothetical protein